MDEAGTEAAAATAVLLTEMAALPRWEPELSLRFDRPFALAVLARPSGAALFLGEVHAPEPWAG